MIQWIADEVNRRLLEWFIKGWREEKPEVADILNSTELWFVLVQNRDGYQYTFDYDRLWRENLRDNDSDNKISILDGVDNKRNFPEHWNYDEEGCRLPPRRRWPRPRGALEASRVFRRRPR